MVPGFLPFSSGFLETQLLAIGCQLSVPFAFSSEEFQESAQHDVSSKSVPIVS